jgi:hypothetical protein
MVSIVFLFFEMVRGVFPLAHTWHMRGKKKEKKREAGLYTW